MAVDATPSRTDFWKVDLGLEDHYWTSYEKRRPNYADSAFLDLIYDYHSAKPNPPGFDLAHDIGCGFGKTTVELVKRFQHVIASDSNESSLSAAQKRLDSLTGNVSFSCCAGENLKEKYASQSADLVCAAECIPLMDSKVAISSFSQVLKPNGTLAIWFYGRAHFSEPDYKAKCQPLFDQIMSLTFAKIINGGNFESQATWKRAADGMASWLDNIDFPPQEWCRVQRRKWNNKSTKMGFSQEMCDFGIEPADYTRDQEEVLELEDSRIWQGEWNLHGIKQYICSSFPGIEQEVEADMRIQQLFHDLGKAMGGENAVRLHTWPIVLLLATRQDNTGYPT